MELVARCLLLSHLLAALAGCGRAPSCPPCAVVCGVADSGGGVMGPRVNGSRGARSGAGLCGEEVLCQGSMQSCTIGCHLGSEVGPHSCVVCHCRPQATLRKDCTHSLRSSKRGRKVCRCKMCTEEECSKACPRGPRLENRGCFALHSADTSTASPAEVGWCLSKDGHHHGKGETWNDGCHHCNCHNGQEMCSLISCPATACANPVIRHGHCCPSCPRDLQTSQTSRKGHAKNLAVCLTSEGDYFAEGKTWSLDSCTQCTCLAGQVLCETKVCPALLCQNAIRTQDSCCPQCPVEPHPLIPSNRSSPGYCRDKLGGVFLEAESWRPDPCSSCVCLDGAIKCFPEFCPPVSCMEPVLHKGQCCPYCLGDAVSTAVCHFDGKSYADEERWDVDGCTHCYCLQGQTLCSTVSCPTLLCQEPMQSGRCCPVCPEMNASTNRHIAKAEQRLGSLVQLPARPTEGNGGLLPLLGEHFGSLRHFEGRMPSASAFRSVAWTTLPTAMVLTAISALIAICQRRRRPHILSTNTPTQTACLKQQLLYAGCHKGVKLDSQRDLQPADPDSAHSSCHEIEQQNILQADCFYQTL